MDRLGDAMRDFISATDLGLILSGCEVRNFMHQAKVFRLIQCSCTDYYSRR